MKKGWKENRVISYLLLSAWIVISLVVWPFLMIFVEDSVILVLFGYLYLFLVLKGFSVIKRILFHKASFYEFCGTSVIFFCILIIVTGLITGHYYRVITGENVIVNREEGDRNVPYYLESRETGEDARSIDETEK